jgi:LCCL domain
MKRGICTSAFMVLLAPLVSRADPKPVNRPGTPIRAEATEVRLIDGSRLYLTVRADQFDVTTPYGKLKIKLADIQRIEFGTRLPGEAAARAAGALALLESTDDKKREEGWRALVELRELAFPTLIKLERHSDRSVSGRAREILAALRKTMPEQKLKKIDRDVIHTEYSKIVGRIESLEVRTTTPHFGELKLRLQDLAMLTTDKSSEDDEIPVNVQPDPGYLTNFQHQVGQSFYFRVTGNIGGSVWGSDVYTTDSQLATVAIHAGVLKIGQTGIVKVTILAGQNGYAGSTRNGVSTSGYGPYPASYKVSKVGAKNKEED